MSDKPPICPCCGSQDVTEYITESWCGDDEWWCQACDVHGPKAAFARRTPPAAAEAARYIEGRAPTVEARNDRVTLTFGSAAEARYCFELLLRAAEEARAQEKSRPGAAGGAVGDGDGPTTP